MLDSSSRRTIALLVIVAALGYFVDIYDILLFSVIRKASLIGIGLSEEQTLGVGLMLLDWQMIGLLLGGFLWGIIGDKKGRLSVLFGSITLYSIANILNAFVASVPQYAFLRFLAGVGLAGELGAGVAIVSETLSKERRGIGTMVIASVGVLGAVVASFVGQMFTWKTSFLVGGGLGIVLLLFRFSLYESGLFEKMKHEDIERGNVFQLFHPWSRLKRFLKAILVALPAWAVVGIPVTLAPEFGKALGLATLPTAGTAVLICYVGISFADVLCSSLSQLWKSRKKVMTLFHAIGFLTMLYYLYVPPTTLTGFYVRCFLLGCGVGYWAVFVTSASEQFGTNLRATVTTTAPNLVRGALVPITIVFTWLKPQLGIIHSAALVVGGCILIALLAVAFSEETFGRDLDFVER